MKRWGSWKDIMLGTNKGRFYIVSTRDGTHHIDFYMRYQVPRWLFFMRGRTRYIGYCYGEDNYSFYFQFV